MKDTNIESVPSKELAPSSEPSVIEPKVDPDRSGLFSEDAFDSFELSKEVLGAIAAKGYSLATPVQAHCIPKALQGIDLIVRSKTGTGKTAAFGIPIVEMIEIGGVRPRALVLAPTRELAIQGAQEIEALGTSKGIRVCAVYGGASMQKQIDALEQGVDVVVGTPGRVMDQMRRGHLVLSEVRHKVLDEADEMLSMGFFEDVCKILGECPKDSQTLLFSATVSPDIEELIENYAHEPETVLLSGDEFSVEGIDNILYETRSDYPKPRNLLYLVELEQPDAAIVFCNTRDDTSLVAAVLNRHGWQAEILNSDLSQKERERVMRRVKAGDLRFMVATDLAARGIDITGLTHVINYSLPEDPAVYMHRVGRTGRIGRGGTAISLMGGRDLSTLSVLEKQFGVVFERRKLPGPDEAREQWTARHIKELKDGMEGSVFEAFLPLVKDVKLRADGDFILAFALKAYFESRRPRSEQEREKGTGSERRDPEKRGSRERGSGERDRGSRDARPGRKGRGSNGGSKERSGGSKERSGGSKERSEGSKERSEGSKERSEGSRTDAASSAAGGGAARGRSDGGKAGDESADAPSGTRLFVSVGSESGLDAAGVASVLCEAAGADPLSVVSTEVREAHSFVTCRDPDAARALLAADSKPYGETTLRVELPREAGSRGPRRARRRTKKQ